MSKLDQKISPIKNYLSPHSPQIKPFQTPAQYLTQMNSTIYQYEQEYYLQLKCDRLESENKELYEHVRIIETQNKQLKTQIQFYRDQVQDKQRFKISKIPNNYQMNNLSPSFSFNEQRLNQYDDSKIEEVQKLLKEIRLLKNIHELEINSHKNQQKRLNKKILELQDVIHQKELQCQAKCQNAEITIQQKNKLLEKDVKDLRKSVVIYMEQRDQNENTIQLLKKQIEAQIQRISELTGRQNAVLQERNQLEEIVREKNAQIEQMIEKYKQKNERDSQQVENQSQKFKKPLYDFGRTSRKAQVTAESNLSIRTFNGYRYVLAEEASSISEALKSEIYRLEKELESQQIQHAKEINDRNFMIQRCQKDVKQKQTDLVNLLTKVKPLLLEKHRMTTKQNISPQQSKRISFEETKQTIGKNAFGLRMLELYLKKYKMQSL